jgi:hypothetical protein
VYQKYFKELDLVSSLLSFYFKGSTPFCVIPPLMIVDIYLKYNLFIPFETRCCSNHFSDGNSIDDEIIKNIPLSKKQVKLEGENVKKLFELFRERERLTESLFMRFNNLVSFGEKICFSYTGFTKDEFTLILNTLKSLNNSPARIKEQALAIYLFWLESGIQQTLISTIFDLNSRQKVSDYCAQVRISLIKDFVPIYLGSNHLSREEFLQKNTIFSKSLFNMTDDLLCIIADGTYIYCQKSSNNKLQRILWSGHKKSPLIKPFVVCSPNGFIIDVYGPYAATENDASILINLLENNKELKSLLKKDDVIVLDRGFRDACVELKNKHELIPKMPACKNTIMLTSP